DPLLGRRNRGETIAWIVQHITYQGDDCLLWPFSRERDGYGTKVQYCGVGFKAHRVMCILAHGNPPRGKPFAAHECGNGHLGCINPRHLAWKSPKQNTHDRFVHGTMFFGEEVPASVLTEQAVLEI